MSTEAQPNVPRAMTHGLAAAIGLVMALGGLILTFTILFPVGIPLAIAGIGVFIWGMWFFKPPSGES